MIQHNSKPKRGQQRAAPFLILFFALALLAPLVLTSTANAVGLPNITGGQGAGNGAYQSGWLGFSTRDFGARVTLVDSQTGQKAYKAASVDYISMLTYNRGYIGGVSGVGGTVPKVEFNEVIVLGGLCKSDYVLGGASLDPTAGGWAYKDPPEPFTDETQTSRLNLGEDFSVLPRTRAKYTLFVKLFKNFCEINQKFCKTTVHLKKNLV